MDREALNPRPPLPTVGEGEANSRRNLAPLSLAQGEGWG
jgi:hypothetical protein